MLKAQYNPPLVSECCKCSDMEVATKEICNDSTCQPPGLFCPAQNVTACFCKEGKFDPCNGRCEKTCPEPTKLQECSAKAQTENKYPECAE